MGSCLSSSSSTTTTTTTITTINWVQPPTAKVIAVDGSLSEYSTAVKVYEVLGSLHPSCFLCNSDELYVDADIPALGSNQSIEVGQLYFMLPVAKLRRKLTGSDMAALAVKASLALAAVEEKRGCGWFMAQVTPVEVVDGGFGEGNLAGRLRRVDESSDGISMSRKKIVRSAKLMSRSNRKRLSTIDEVGE